jgi:hypothetical protein
MDGDKTIILKLIVVVIAAVGIFGNVLNFVAHLEHQ